MKYKYYIGIIGEGNQIKYVTKINNATRTALWEDGKPALKMSLTNAKDLVYGLVCNWFSAVVITAPVGMVLANYMEVEQ